MAQTTITANPAVGQEGQLATSAPFSLSSRVSAGAVPVGFLVVQGATSAECTVPGVTGDVTGGSALGIAKLDASRSTAAYADNEQVTIVTAGEVWVNATTAATAGGVVYVVHATGAIRGTADASATALPNATFLTSGTGLQKVKLGGVFS